VNCSPVYFNMTRWALAYGGPGGAWTDAVVDAYVAQISQNALNGTPIVSRRRAAPTSQDLLFIPPAVIAPCGAGPVLFNRPVGSATGGADNNGQTHLAAFHCVMNAGGPAPPFPATPHAYFAIIDSNAAHHLSALLAEHSFVGLPAGWAKVIVNFDAHSDFGTQINPNSYRCDNWGIYTVRPVANVFAAAVADMYVGFGNKPGSAWATSFYRMRPPGPAPQQQLAGATVTAQVQALLAAVNANAVLLNGAPWLGIAVYVTIDRDVMEASFTDYGDGPYPAVALYQAVHECLQVFRGSGVALRGVDICGLPTWTGGSAKQPTWGPAQRQARANVDIHSLYGQVVAY